MIAYADTSALPFADAAPVARLAIGESMDHDEFLLLQSNERWTILGSTAHASVAEARERAAQLAPGVEQQWIDRPLTNEDAAAYLDELWKDQKCSFCGRRPDQVTRIVQNGDARICDICIREFRERLSSDGTEN